jgi:diphosphomevalonate decarboxylase
LFTQVKVSWKNKDTLETDTLSINGIIQEGKPLERVSTFLEQLRLLAGIDLVADVVSETNIPSGTGVASSAAAFAALSLAASRSAGLTLDPIALSCLARRGSGSACRSIASGFTEWMVGDSDQTSYATSIAPPGHWALVDVIAIISEEHKTTGSTEGHSLAASSPLQLPRVEDAPRRLDVCRRAILEKDFYSLAEIVEADSNLMHAVMITSSPPLFYWQGTTLSLMQAVQKARSGGLQACYTVDAGPNVHVICSEESLNETLDLINSFEGVMNVLVTRVGGPVRLLNVE